MGREVKDFVEATLDVYPQKAMWIWPMKLLHETEVINHYFDSIQELATEEIRKNPESIVTGRDYFQVINFLERIGDYAKNICEWVVYFETGKIIEM